MISLRNPLWLTALAASFALVACGGKVVVDQGTTPGSGGSTTSTTTTGLGALTGTGGDGGGSVGGGGGAGGCDGLYAAFDAQLSEAQACNPALSTIQCSGKVTTVDACGCEVAANDMSFGAAQNASSAFMSWVAAGCGPYECFGCPPPPGSSTWFCDPNTSQCQPTWNE